MIMADAVVQGATLVCTCGSAPAKLIVTSQTTVKIGGQPAATVGDNKPILNVASFGACAKGGPCVPAFPAPWVPGATSPVKIGGQQGLLSTDKLACAAFTGMVSIVDPGQTKTHDA
jgi:uncharacterized Zn-binding protein involved in type VI secretion